MKIWHMGALYHPGTVGGCNQMIWNLASYQMRAGHEVVLVVNLGSEDVVSIKQQNTLERWNVPGSWWRLDPDAISRRLQFDPPNIVHLHSVFMPSLASLAKQLRQYNIPYIVTPHSRMLPQPLERRWLWKYVYNWLIEKNRFNSAAAITVATPHEYDEMKRFLPGYRGVLRQIFNPSEPDAFLGQKWKGNFSAKRLVYLGRFDIFVKGIDRLVEVARYLPDVEFHLYGVEDSKTKDWLERLKSNIPSNVYFHSPIYGAEKAKVLAEATMYIQMSRSEVFGLSIIEAMATGTPCAIASSMNVVRIFRQHDLGLILPENPQAAAKILAQALVEKAQLLEWSERSHTFAKTYLNLQAVGDQYLQLYEEVLCQHPKSYLVRSYSRA